MKKIKSYASLRNNKNKINARKKQIKKYWLKKKKNCAYCTIPLTPNNITVDHIIPKSKHGSDHTENFAPCCQNCNKEKKDLTLTEFLKEK